MVMHEQSGELEFTEDDFAMRSLGGLSRSGTLLNSLLTSKRTFSGDITPTGALRSPQPRLWNLRS